MLSKIKTAGIAALLVTLSIGAFAAIRATAKSALPVNPISETLREFSPEEKAATFNALAAKDAVRSDLQEKLDSLWEISNRKATDDGAITSCLTECRALQAQSAERIKAIDEELKGQVSLRVQARLYYLGVLENGLTKDPWTFRAGAKSGEKTTPLQVPKKTAQPLWFLPKGPGLD
jgi:hypothetical protein